MVINSPIKVIFLGNGSDYSQKAFNILKKYTNNIFFFHNKKGKINEFSVGYDLGISFLYPYLVPKEETHKAVWINFHPAMLPEYGGRNIAYHAIMNQEKKFGGAIHYMDEKYDSCDIIEVEKFEIDKSMTAFDIYKKSYFRWQIKN